MQNEKPGPKSRDNMRKITARWVITAEMVLTSATHFGGEVESAVDMTILRDSFSGKPLLTGTSLAGALRSHLSDTLVGYRADEDNQDVPLLFGGSRSDDFGFQSPLIVFDSLGEIPSGMTIEIRDGVAIDTTTGTAEAHAKYDMELLPAGTVFPLRVDLIVEEDGSQSSDKMGLEKWQLTLLTRSLDGLNNEDISLGMKKNRGLGSVTTKNWKALRYDLKKKKGWLKWITSDHLDPLPQKTPVHDSPKNAIKSALPEWDIESRSDSRKRLLIDLNMNITGDLLVRSPAHDPTGPDVKHLQSGGKPVLPGTGLAGAMRAQALRIARLVRAPTNDGDKWVEGIFGAPKTEKKKKMHASKLRVSESIITGGGQRRQSRIAIDRFSGGVVQSALFDEEVQAGGTLKVRLELQDPADAEIGLVLLLVKDLLAGDIPVGGASSVGRGILAGTAQIHFSDGTSVKIASDLKVEETALNLFNKYILAFHEAEYSDKEVNHGQS